MLVSVRTSNGWLFGINGETHAGGGVTSARESTEAGNGSEPEDRAPTVIFIHIPKTAGVSLHMAMGRQYPKEGIYGMDPDTPIESTERFKNLPLEQRKSIRLLRGHIGFGLHSYLPQQSVYITLLRDPVERVISHYYYIRQSIRSGVVYTNRPWLHDAEHMSLGDYARHGRSGDLRNGQIKFLSGALGGWDVDATDEMRPEMLLALARENVAKHFLVVGLTERFDESLLMLRRALRWKMPFYVRYNVTKDRPMTHEISKETRRILERCNEYDIEFYQESVRSFRQRQAELGDTFENELKRFRMQNAAYNVCYGPVYRVVAKARHLLSGLR